MTAEAKAKLANVSDEQVNNMLEALERDGVSTYVDFDQYQIAAMEKLGIDKEEASKIANSAFASALRGKVQSVIDRAIKAKYHAMNKGKDALSAECEAEIQEFMNLKRKLA